MAYTPRSSHAVDLVQALGVDGFDILLILARRVGLYDTSWECCGFDAGSNIFLEQCSVYTAISGDHIAHLELESRRT